MLCNFQLLMLSFIVNYANKVFIHIKVLKSVLESSVIGWCCHLVSTPVITGDSGTPSGWSFTYGGLH